MRRTLAVIFAVLLALPAVGLGAGVAGAQSGTDAVDCSYPITLTDATGTNVTVSEDPERVVVLSHSTAQTMWAIGAQDEVVGLPIDQYSAYLEGREGKQDVTDSQSQPVTEEIVAAEPDLVLAGNNIQPPAINATRGAVDAPVYRAGAATSLEDVARKTERLGQLVGEFDAAAEQASMTRGNASAVGEAVEGLDRPTVYYVMGGGFTAGTETFIGNAIELAGGRNVAEAAGISFYDEIDQETIVAEDPDWLVLTGEMPVPKTAALNESTAVQEDQILRVDANFLTQPGPKTVIPLREMARAFHSEATSGDDLAPDTYPEATQCAGDVATTAAPTTTDTATDATSPATTDATTAPETTESTGGGSPGFGPVAAVVAMALGLGVLARRD